MKEKLGLKVIIFFGSDGTGKTTQANFLMRQLRLNGFKVSRAWIRGRHSVAFYLSQILLKLGYKGYFVAPYAPGGKILDTRTLHGKWFWSFVEFLSVVPLIIRRMYLPLYTGRRVVAERYVVDTVVYNRFYIGTCFDTYARILLRMIPSDSLLIHLDAPKSVVLSRRADDLVSEEFINYQLVSYRQFASKLHALSIDTSKTDIQSVSDQILRKVNEHSS